MNKLYIITGPAGVGKSTISYEVGKKLKKISCDRRRHNLQFLCRR